MSTLGQEIKSSEHRVRDLFLLGAGASLFAYILLRAIHASFTVDEQGSYTMFVVEGNIFPKEYNVFSANNHALNTAMMWLMSKLCGAGVLSLRFPTVLASGLYLYSIAMMSRRVQYPLAGAVMFLLATTNPILLEYFGLARGYGLANGLIAFGLWQMWLYCDNGYRWRNLVGALFPCALAVFANYSYLNLFLPIAGGAFIIALWQPSSPKSLTKNRLPQAALSLGLVSLVLFIVIPISMKISAAGGFWKNKLTGFWDGSVLSAIDFSLMNRAMSEGSKEVIIIILQVLTALLSVRIIWWTIAHWRRRKFELFPLFLLGVLVFGCVSVVLQYHWRDVPLPLHRMCLFFVWPWLLVLGISGSLTSKLNRWITFLMLLISALPVANFFLTISIEDSAFRPPSVQVDDAFAYMREKNTGDQRILLGYDISLLSFGVDYYNVTHQMKEFDITADSMTTHPLNQYCLITPSYAGKIGGNWVVEQTYLNGNVLYRNSTRPLKPISTFIPPISSDTISNDWQGRGLINYSFHVPDSAKAPLGSVMRLEYSLTTTEASDPNIDVLVLRGDNQIRFVRTYVQTEADRPTLGKNDIIMPPLLPGDFVVAVLYCDLEKLKTIEYFNIKVDQY